MSTLAEIMKFWAAPSNNENEGTETESHRHGIQINLDPFNWLRPWIDMWTRAAEPPRTESLHHLIQHQFLRCNSPETITPDAAPAFSTYRHQGLFMFIRFATKLWSGLPRAAPWLIAYGLARAQTSLVISIAFGLFVSMQSNMFDCCDICSSLNHISRDRNGDL